MKAINWFNAFVDNLGDTLKVRCAVCVCVLCVYSVCTLCVLLVIAMVAQMSILTTMAVAVIFRIIDTTVSPTVAAPLTTGMQRLKWESTRTEWLEQWAAWARWA